LFHQIVLTFLLCHFAEVDGMMGAGMIAGQATRTVRLPLRNLINYDVAHGTHLAASAA
jgi:hypothetical protein